AGRQLQIAGPVDAGRDRERRVGARGRIDGGLQHAALVLAAAGAQAEMRRVEPERSERRSGSGGEGGRGGCAGRNSAEPEQMAAVDVHGMPPATSSRTDSWPEGFTLE